MSATKTDDELHIWKHPKLLFGHETPLRDEDYGVTPEEGDANKINTYFIEIGTQATLHQQVHADPWKGKKAETASIYYRVKSKLKMSDKSAWCKQWPFYEPVLRAFYPKDNPCPAWWCIISRRLSFRSRLSLPVVSLPVKPKPVDAHGRVHLGFAGCVSLENLILTDRNGNAGGTGLCRAEAPREFHDGGEIIRPREVWLCQAREDEYGRLRGSVVPAMEPYFDPATKVVSVASVLFFKMTPSGWVTSICVDLRPEEGETLALRSGQMPLAFQLRGHLYEGNRMLVQALRKGKRWAELVAAMN